jgi:hypothetical protein
VKYAFASSRWFAALHGILAQRAVILSARFPKYRSSICEVFYDAPAALSAGAGRIAWSCVTIGSHVDFQLRERDDVQFKSQGQFETVAQLAVFDTKGDPMRRAQLVAMADAARVAGKLKDLIGQGLAEPGDLPLAHDLIARLTA